MPETNYNFDYASTGCPYGTGLMFTSNYGCCNKLSKSMRAGKGFVMMTENRKPFCEHDDGLEESFFNTAYRTGIVLSFPGVRAPYLRIIGANQEDVDNTCEDLEKRIGFRLIPISYPKLQLSPSH